MCQSASQRDYAHDLQALHRKSRGGMAANLQGRFQLTSRTQPRELKNQQALQLLEFLIKNGSERVIDDARSHLSLLKMLRQFHYIDQNGKDQGINVRNRSKELAELLSDVDRIRSERRKAKTNRNKFGGVAGGGMSSGISSGGSRYGGFGSEESSGYGAYSGGVYGDGGGFGVQQSTFQDSQSRKDRFEEYDEYDEGAVASPTARTSAPSASTVGSRNLKKQDPPKKEPEKDMLSFDDADIPPITPPKEFAYNGKKPATNPMDDLGMLGASAPVTTTNEEDDFDDFQSATPEPATAAVAKPSIPSIQPPSSMLAMPSTQFAAPKPISASQGNNMTDLVGFNSISPAPSTVTTSAFTSPPTSTFTSPPPTQGRAPKPTGFQNPTPNYYTTVQASQPSSTSSAYSGSTPSNSATLGKPMTKPSTGTQGGDAFAALLSSTAVGSGMKKSTPASQGPNLASMAKEKASAGIWGAAGTSSHISSSTTQFGIQGNGTRRLGDGLDDLLG